MFIVRLLLTACHPWPNALSHSHALVFSLSQRCFILPFYSPAHSRSLFTSTLLSISPSPTIHTHIHTYIHPLQPTPTYPLPFILLVPPYLRYSSSSKHSLCANTPQTLPLLHSPIEPLYSPYPAIFLVHSLTGNSLDSQRPTIIHPSVPFHEKHSQLLNASLGTL